ncbi:MAG: dihydropteroate synthase [Planctomycetota bacterium]
MNSDMSTTWRIGGDRVLDLRTPAVMAILNVTPDSFSDGGELSTIDAVVRRATAAIDDGAHILDIGGESTRPGAGRVDAEEQIRRVVPAVEAILGKRCDAIISVDTTLAQVAAAAIDAGAAIVNDVSMAQDDLALMDVVAQHQVGYVLMHRVLPPNKDKYSDQYDAPIVEADILNEVSIDLVATCKVLEHVGINRERIVFDPGLGFGKTVEQNLELIRRTPELTELGGRPVLSGLSRKSFVGRVSLERDSQPTERSAGTTALTALHRAAGASVFRVHDVAPAVQALRSADALARTDL